MQMRKSFCLIITGNCQSKKADLLNTEEADFLSRFWDAGIPAGVLVVIFKILLRTTGLYAFLRDVFNCLSNQTHTHTHTGLYDRRQRSIEVVGVYDSSITQHCSLGAVDMIGIIKRFHGRWGKIGQLMNRPPTPRKLSQNIGNSPSSDIAAPTNTEGTLTIISVLTMYGTYLGANFLSNHLNHPFQKLDYGVLNNLFFDGRPLSSSYWGTRLPHLILVPAGLTFYDILCGKISTKYFGLKSFRATPGAWLLNLYCFTFLGVGSFFAYDSALNPNYEGIIFSLHMRWTCPRRLMRHSFFISCVSVVEMSNCTFYTSTE